MKEIYSCDNCGNRGNDTKACAKCVSEADNDNSIPSNWTPVDRVKHSVDDADNVNHPNHYQTKSGIEAIDVIDAFTNGLDGLEAFDTGNIIKYICRWKKKNGLEDLKKAKWYLENLINHLEKEN